MNEKLYNIDAYAKNFTSDVVSVSERVFENEQVYDIVLENTCFFPEQGGQTSDTGLIYDLDSEKVFKVFHVSTENDIEHHFVRAVEVNETLKDVIKDLKKVRGEINWEERYDKMQNHSGEHLVSGTVHRFFGYDNVGFSLSSENVTLDFNGTFTDEELDRVEREVNKAVYENFEVIVTYPTEEELKTLEYRSKKELTGEVRIVEYPGYDVCACCAPHVKRTGEIGMIKIVSAEHFKGGTRMTIRCGYRALADYGTKLSSCKSISKTLSVPVDEVSKGVAKLSEDNRALSFKINGLYAQILALKADSVKPERINVGEEEFEALMIFDGCADMNTARKLVSDRIKPLQNTENKAGMLVSIFIGDEEKGYSFCIGSGETDCRKVLSVLKTGLNAKGGGSETMIQGSVSASEAEIRELFRRRNE